MNKTIKEIKGQARFSLSGNYATLILAMIFIELVSNLLESPFANMLSEGLSFTNLYRICIGIAGALIVSILIYLLDCGRAYMHLCTGRGSRPKTIDIFVPFRNKPDRFIILGVIVVLISSACYAPAFICFALTEIMPAMYTTFLIIGSVLTLIGSIVYLVLTLGLTLAPYILLDDIECSTGSAIRQSFSLMKGNRLKLLGMYISFIGLLLLGIFTVFIAYIWIFPYIHQSIAQFYLNIKNKNEDAL